MLEWFFLFFLLCVVDGIIWVYVFVWFCRMMFVGWGGNNGFIFMVGILVNKEYVVFFYFFGYLV